MSKEYVNSKTKYTWQCKKGHRWDTLFHIVQSGGWCPHCAGRARLTIEDMHETAKKKGGRCLTKEYVNSNTKMLWQCEKGHKWMAQPKKIRSGRWCPHKKCRYENVAKKLRNDIGDLKELAKNKGGRLLSRKYKNRHTNLKWQCKDGHKWYANSSNVIFGRTWCPVCARRKA